MSNSCDWRDRLGEIGASNRPSVSPASRRPSELNSTSGSVGRLLADLPRQRERRPSPACACRGSRGRRPRPRRASRSASSGDSVSRGAMPHFAVCSAEHAAVGGVVVDDQHALAVRAPAARRRSRGGSRGGSSATGARIVKLNVAPLPAPSLSAHIVPPISSASRLLIARPRPVPPYLRVVDESACENDWNSRLIPSGGQADAGVAHRERQLDLAAGRAPVAVTVSTTSPASVNLTALLSRLSRICRSRVTSPTHAPAARRPRTGRRCRGASRPRAR